MVASTRLAPLPDRWGIGRGTATLAAGLLVVAACPGWGATWTDALGRSVEFSQPPRRIVSLVPSVTETLFSLGVDDRLVGVTRYCDFPAEAQTKPSVGGYADPSLESILALAPDLVIAAADAHRPSLVAQIEAAGVPVFVVNPQTFAETVQAIRTLGALLGAPASAGAVAAELEGRLAAARALLAATGAVSVVVSVMVEPLVVAGPRTLAGDLLERLGARNAVPDGPSRFPTWGPESLLAADPGVIVVAAHDAGPLAEEAFSAWPELRAVREGRVSQVDADWIHRPGPRLGLGVAALARILADTGGSR